MAAMFTKLPNGFFGPKYTEFVQRKQTSSWGWNFLSLFQARYRIHVDKEIKRYWAIWLFHDDRPQVFLGFINTSPQHISAVLQRACLRGEGDGVGWGGVEMGNGDTDVK